jgi:predicted DNA-binding transcriptional regulator AlpA
MSENQDGATLQMLLRAYPLLPSNALVPRPVIMALAGISDSRLWEHVREGTLATPIRTGRRGVHWRKEWVEAFLNLDRPLASMGESPVGRKRQGDSENG